ncbi:RNA-dependent RNA polymerase [Phytophthora cinnamomi ormycovirus 6-4]|uniref:RNA-dependent RNA polymerase n=1 Tax=Phytophthora cinnamomi ormycovirus 6-4 TaxID=3239325 RepID=A0AB39JEH7_9VIRU
MASSLPRGHENMLPAVTRLGGIPSRQFTLPTSYNSASSGLGLPNPEFGEIKSTSKLDLQKGKLRWGGTWVNHDIRETKHFLGLGPPTYSFTAIMNSPGSEALKAELCRFLLCLKLWETTPGRKIISPGEVWVKALLNPNFAEELDDLFQITWREKEIDSYNFVFPARFLPRFKEYTDDIKWSLLPTYADKEALSEFSQTLEEILENIPAVAEDVLVDDRSILEDRSTTTSYIPSLDKTLPHWEASFIDQGFQTKVLEGKRCIVNVYPGGTRDTIIASKSANNSVRWLERTLKKILTYIPESAISSYTSVFHKRIEDVINKRGHHVLRDIKKCGLTYNSRELFPIVKEQLMKKFPDCRWNRIDMFQDMRVYDDGKEYRPVRGYCLGMANALVTLCNIVVMYICVNRMKLSSRVPEFECSGIIGNDDADVVFFQKKKKYNTYAAAQEYLSTEHDVQGGLGNLTNLKKSVIMPFGLFYEQYSKPGWRTKESLVCNALACAYLAPDIRTAKNYIFSQSDRFDSKWAIGQLVELALFWGPEFYSVEDELKSHYEVGGWLDLRQMGLKTTLLDIDRLLQRFSLQRVSVVTKLCKRYTNPPSPQKKKDGQVYNSLYTGPAIKADADIQLWTILDVDLIEYYRKLTTFQRNYERRIATFKLQTAFKPHEDLISLQKEFLGNNAWYAIPDSIAEVISWWEEPLALDVKSEFCPLDVEDQRPENKLVRLQNNEEYEPVAKFRLRPDPLIPPDALKARVHAPIGIIYQSAAFSNSGALPIYEYFSRTSRVPKFPDWVPGSFVQGARARAEMQVEVRSRHRKDLTPTDTYEHLLESDHGAWEVTEYESDHNEEGGFFDIDQFLMPGEGELEITAGPPVVPASSQPQSSMNLTLEDLEVLDSFDVNDTEVFGNYLTSIRMRAYENPEPAVADLDEDMDLGFGDDADY